MAALMVLESVGVFFPQYSNNFLEVITSFVSQTLSQRNFLNSFVNYHFSKSSIKKKKSEK